jgi:hypothetical protein
MEAGQYNLESGQNVSEAVMSEARRSFCKSWYKLSGLYECRDTMLIESRLFINLLLFY